MSSAPSIELAAVAQAPAQARRRARHKVLVAHTSDAVARNLGAMCQYHGCDVEYCKDGARLISTLVRGRHVALFIEFAFLEHQRSDLLQDIHRTSALQNLFVIAFAPKHLERDQLRMLEAANTLLQPPYSEERVVALLRRALAMPKRILLISPWPRNEWQEAMRRVGYDVQYLPSVQALSEVQDPYRPDFVITEYHAGGDHGLGLCTEPPPVLQGVPLLVAYGGREANDIELILKTHKGEVMLSPFESPTNLKKIQDLCPLAPKGRRLRALVVDDSPTIRSLIVSMFKEMDYLVETAANGFEAWKAVERFTPDIITSDYDMPVLNGWQFCSELRDHERFRDIPVIMISTRASALDLRKGELLGVSAYLTKPFTRDGLRQAIDMAVRNARIKKEQETIAKFVAADTLKAVNNMVSDGHFSNGEDKFITVLFSDICAFSSKCEKYSARKIVRLLNHYFDLMVDVLSEHDAIIDKFIGDAIVARFDSGDPVRDALNAVRAGWHMQERLRQFNLEAFEEIQIRVGINSGHVILGNLGSERHRLEYAMIGDNVNIGQRLESSAPVQKCLMSEATWNLVQEQVLVGERQEIQVKGKSQPVLAYVLEGLR